MKRLAATGLAVLVGHLLLLGPAAADGGAARGLGLGRGGGTFGVSGAARRVLVVGIDGYGGDRYGPLTFARADARALAARFQKLGYDVTLMVDGDPSVPAALVPTYRNLDDQIHAFCRSSRNPDDTLIVCFAGHGDVVHGQSVLIPVDYEEEERAFTLGALFDALQHGQARKKLVVLDACRSSTIDGGRRLASGFLAPAAQAEELVVLSGCGPDQSSYEDPELGHGRLTAVLLEGLGGAAFGERREFLFGHELWGYVERTFNERGWVETQSPAMFGRWDARVRFDLARRDVQPPPPIEEEDREVFGLAMERAESKLADLDATASIRYCVTALRILPDDPDALALRSLAYLQLGYNDQAFADAQRCLEGESTHVLGLLVRATVTSARGNPNLGMVETARAAAAFLADPQGWMERLPRTMRGAVWIAIGSAHAMMAGSSPFEVAAYTRAIEVGGLPPDMTAQAWIGRGLAYDVLGRYEEALADFDHVIGEPTTPWLQRSWALFDRALVLDHMGRTEEAMAAYGEVLELAWVPPDVLGRAVLNRGWALHRLGRQEEARAHYDRVFEIPGVETEARFWAFQDRGFLEEQQGRAQAALADYDGAIACDGVPFATLIPVLLQRGRLRGTLGLLDGAVEDFGRIADAPGLAPQFRAQGLRFRAEAYYLQGRRDAEATDLERLLGMDHALPTEVFAGLLARGRLRSDTGRYADALADYDRALAMDGTNRGAHLGRGWVLLLLGRWEGARSSYEQALAGLAPPSELRGGLAGLRSRPGAAPEIRVFEAWLALAAGNADEARRHLDAYQAAAPEGPLASWALELRGQALRSGREKR